MRTTKYTNKGMFRTTNGHEWTRIKPENHEWTRMDTNSVAMVIQNHERHERHETHEIEQRVIEPRMDTNGHE